MVVSLFDSPDGMIVAVQTAQPALAARPISLVLPGPRTVLDLRTNSGLGRTERLTLTLDPIDPTILLLQP